MAITKKTAAIIAGVAAVAIIGGGITAVALGSGGSADASGTPAAKGDAPAFNLTADQDRVHLDAVPEAVASLKAGGFEPIEAGKLTVVTSPFAAPLALYADDDTTLIGNEVDLAQLIADGLETARLERRDRLRHRVEVHAVLIGGEVERRGR